MPRTVDLTTKPKYQIHITEFHLTREANKLNPRVSTEYAELSVEVTDGELSVSKKLRLEYPYNPADLVGDLLELIGRFEYTPIGGFHRQQSTQDVAEHAVGISNEERRKSDELGGLTE